MAGSVGIITGFGFTKAGLTGMARILGNLGTPITAASIASITWQCTDLNLVLATGSGTLTPANVIFNNLVQNDPRWDRDSQARPGRDGQWGYNFLNLFPASCFQNFDTDNTTTPPTIKPHTYQIDVTFVPVTGENFKAQFKALCLPTFP